MRTEIQYLLKQIQDEMVGLAVTYGITDKDVGRIEELLLDIRDAELKQLRSEVPR